MASNLTHLPHIRNVQSGINKYDPMHSAMYEVYFTLPEAIQSQFKDDEAVLTEQVTEVTGLDALQKTVGAGQQKFMGVDVSFLNPTLDNTYAELTINLNLNKTLTVFHTCLLFEYIKSGFLCLGDKILNRGTSGIC